MPEIPEAHADAMKRHVADGETVVETETRGAGTAAVTDRRFYRVWRNDDDEQTVHSVVLDAVTDVSVKRVPDEKPSWGLVGFGVMAAVAGLAILGYLSQIHHSKTLAGIVAIVGLVGLVVGIILVAMGLDTEDGHVKLVVYTPVDSMNGTYPLDSYFAETVSEQVSSRSD